jgi:septal ring factor EnvC (AmiA/AmiB activator)
MIQINLLQVVDWLKRYSGWIVAGILLLMMFNCEPDSAFARKQRDKENKKYEKKIDSLYGAIKSKDKVIAKSEKNVAEKEQKIKSLNGKIASLEKNKTREIAKLNDFALTDWKKYYQEKTGYGDKQIQIDGTAIKMTREPLVAIGKELVQGDYAKAELKITKQVLSETQSIIVEKDKIIETERQKFVDLQSVVESNEEIKENLVKNIDDLQSDLKKAKRPKATTIIISALLGGLAGAVLTN